MSFKPNRQLVSELKRGKPFQDVLDATAAALKEAAQREAPIGATEDYIHGFVITKTPTTRTVGNTDFAAHLVEWGSVNNPPYAPLRRGVHMLGLRFVEASRI